jgi:hypothetical protein
MLTDVAWDIDQSRRLIEQSRVLITQGRDRLAEAKKIIAESNRFYSVVAPVPLVDPLYATKEDVETAKAEFERRDTRSGR